MSDRTTIGTGETRVEVFTIPSVHAEGMLAAYVPSAKVLFISDILTPAPNPTPAAAAGARELVAFARERGIVVERLAGGHGPAWTWAQVGELAQR